MSEINLWRAIGGLLLAFACLILALFSLTLHNTALAIYGFVFFFSLTIIFGFLSLPPGER